MAASMKHVKNDNLSQISQTPVRKGFIIPPGHIIVSEKWRGTQLATALQGSANVLYQDRLGIVDFHPSAETAVIYLSEGDLVMGTAYKRKVVKLRKVESMRGIVMVEKTPSTNQYFGPLQQFVAITLGMVVLPVSSQQEGGSLLAQMVHIENRPVLNPLRIKRKTVAIDQGVLLTIQSIPKLGEVKAKALLEKFHSIEGICDASIEELTSVVGKASAMNIKKFFTEPP